MLERKLVFWSFRKTMIQKVSKVLKTKLHQASFRVTQLGASYYYLSWRETLALLDSEIKVSSHKKETTGRLERGIFPTSISTKWCRVHEFISASLDPCFLTYKPQQVHRCPPGGLESHNLLCSVFDKSFYIHPEKAQSWSKDHMTYN